MGERDGDLASIAGAVSQAPPVHQRHHHPVHNSSALEPLDRE